MKRKGMASFWIWCVRLAASLALILAVAYGLVFWFLRNPVSDFGSGAAALASQTPAADPARLEKDVRRLAAIEPGRHAGNPAALDLAAAHIEQSFRGSGCRIELQPFEVRGRSYKNVICHLGPSNAAVLVLGGHYDTAGSNNPGADDNASGVAGLLELARLLAPAAADLPHRLELAAYSLEEPPHFGLESMGSFVHAEGLAKAGIPVKLMISVEMIGYFTGQANSQHYPIPLLSWLYPDRGDFIGVVGQSLDRGSVAQVKALMAGDQRLPVYSINAPAFVPGVDYSDHRNFWHFNLPAVMVTDTAFLRNPNYHQPSDRPETLDYERMALVVEGLYRVARHY